MAVTESARALQEAGLDPRQTGRELLVLQGRLFGMSTSEAAERALPIAFPSLALSTDNAAMIAAAAYPKLITDDIAPETLTADPSLALGSAAGQGGKPI